MYKNLKYEIVNNSYIEIVEYSGAEKNVVIPDRVTTIGAKAF